MITEYHHIGKMSDKSEKAARESYVDWIYEESQKLSNELKNSKYKYLTYENKCKRVVEYIYTIYLRIHKSDSSKMCKEKDMELFMMISVGLLKTFGKKIFIPYDIYLCTPIEGFSQTTPELRKNGIEFRNISLLAFFVMHDYSTLVKYILKDIITEFCDRAKVCYASKLHENVNQTSFGTKQYNIFELSILCGSRSTLMQLLMYFKPVVRSDVMNIGNISGFKDHEKLYKLLSSYRKLYLVSAYRKPEYIEYYTLKCTNADCRNYSCLNNVEKKNRKRQGLIYSKKLYNEVYKEFRDSVREFYK